MSRALGRYELLRPLARGGMAEVFLARRRSAGVEKWLVVKRMRPERAGDPRFLELFVREARLSMSLAHQNIVPVFDFGRIDDQVFIAMERVEGQDLGSSLAKATTPLSPLLAAFIAAECCQALSYAHLRRGPDGTALGIVHRDVTPRNVMLSWSGEVKLTDFGIASLAGETGSVIGTPSYMAPEQARGEQVDVRADVYAVGMMLREALTGKRGRGGAEREATLARARAGELLPWPEDAPVSWSALRVIADRATSAEPPARYPDAHAMLDELDAFIVDERAANKSDAPARGLADWLATTFAGHREEANDEAIEGSHLVSFLDDGGLDAMGTGTERSMEATAAEAPVPAPDVTPPAPSRPAAFVKRPRWLVPLIALGALGGLGGVAIAIVGLTGSAPPPPPARPPPARTPVVVVDPARDPARDAAVVAEIMVPRDAEIAEAAPPDAAASVKHLKPKPPAIESPRRDLPLRTIRVNSSPWSYFTVDADPTKHETLETIRVTSGAHTIHFTRDTIQHDVEVTVPDDDAFTITQDMSH